MKRITAIMLSLIMIFSAMSVLTFTVTADDETSGQIGESVFWEFDKVERKLRITGTGAMDNMPDGRQPWRDQFQYITYVSIEDGVTSISAGAFSSLPRLQVVEIPKSIEEIDGSAFTVCPMLENFIVASGNKVFLANDVNLTDGILYDIDKTTIVRFPSSCKVINKTETTFTLPETVTTIGDFAFEGNTTLTGIKMNKTGQLETIGRYAFSDCTAIKSFDFTYQPDLTEIGDGAFSGCTALSEFKVWNSLDKNKLGNGIFEGCNTISNFIFYGTKTELGNLNISLPGNTLSSVHCKNSDSLIQYYFIKYDPNGGTIGKEFEIISNGSDTTISDIEPVSSGRSFIGWSTDPKATTAISAYSAGSSYSAANGNLYLFAVYNTTMLLTFDLNGGEGEIKPLSFVSKTELTIPNIIPTRSGYEFKGWSKSKNAVNAAFVAGGKITVDSSITLYAVWESVGPYDITYYNGSVLIATDKAVKVKNVDYTITRTATKEPASRYEFIGWSKTNGGSVDYATGSALKENDNITLYAVYKDNGPYDIYVHTDMNDYGQYVMLSQSSKGAAVTISVSPVAYSDWKFLGWSVNYYADAVDYEAGASIVPTQDMHLYPYVEIINHTSDATLSIKSQTVTVDYRNTVTITADAYNVPSGYGIAVYTGGSKSAVCFAPADSTGHASLSYETSEMTAATSYTVKVTKSGANAGVNNTGSDGKVLSAKINIEVNKNLLLVIIAFFRGIFTSQPTKPVK